MKILKKYGNAPFNVVVVHGGPGAPGEMAPVAQELSSYNGVLEPFQSASTIEGQLKELQSILSEKATLPVTLIGWSWGAWLSFIFTAQYPALVKKLILVGSGPFEDKYASCIMKTRLSRLSEEERADAVSMMEILNDTATKDKENLMRQFGKLFFKSDSYNPLEHNHEVLELQYDIYLNVWEQAKALRSSGKLLEYGKNIQSPVVAIHGDYDPHPFQGIKEPLSRVLRDFRFILLENCGHYPWFEKAARDRFYEVLKKELEY